VPSDCESTNEVVIVEKFPEHVFRVPFLTQLICCSILGHHLGTNRPPQFIHIIRNPVCVARSIALKMQSDQSWFGVKLMRKWSCLSLICHAHLDFPSGFASRFLPSRVLTEGSSQIHFPSSSSFQRYFAMGLVEWGLSVIYAREGRSFLQQVRGIEDASRLYMEIFYEDLVTSPSETIGRTWARKNVNKERIRGDPTPEEFDVLRSLEDSPLKQLIDDITRRCDRAYV